MVRDRLSVLFHIGYGVGLHGNGLIGVELIGHTLVGLIVCVDGLRGEAAHCISEVILLLVRLDHIRALLLVASHRLVLNVGVDTLFLR